MHGTVDVAWCGYRPIASRPIAGGAQTFLVFYYESRKRDLKTRLIYEDRCDERLKN
jgi:hypothetical protein